MKSEYILIAGARSDMADALARRYAESGYNLYLAARKARELEDTVQDFKIRYRIDAVSLELDLSDANAHRQFYDNLDPKPEGIICAAGYLGDQKRAEKDFEESLDIVNSNYLGYISLLNIVAEDMEKRGSGFIIGISSVAGDRGRKNNYVYGSAKAAFSAYLSGLRHRLYESGVSVLTVKPGFVKTKMTENLELPEKLTALPEEAAADIFKAWKKGKDVIYTKWMWKYIMFIIRNLPEKIFKKTNL